MTGTLPPAPPDERWAEIEAVFAAALDTPASAREPLLAGCSDETVRVEVRRLLARHDSPGFLDVMDFARATALLEEDETPDPEQIGRYGIVRRLGRGGSGIVYLARDSLLDRQVALKLLAPSLNADALAARRFAEEARAASALDHPNIARVYELGHAGDGRLFIAMAYHEGETLRDRIGRGPLPIEDAVRIAAEIADGLSVAHAKGIVHRDIKPENVLLTPRGACIVDFGIAKVLGHTLTRTGVALGTAAYMSPEQTRGAGVDHRSDVWSLGVVLYEMLAGSRPFTAEGGEALVYAIRHDRPEPLVARRPEVGPHLRAVLDRCLEKDPEWRYQSAHDLLRALRAPPVEPLAGLATPRWKRLGLVVGGAGIAGVAVLAAPGVPVSGDRLSFTQLSTVLPPSPAPGAIAILPFAEGPANESLEGRQYLEEGIEEGVSEELTRILAATPGIRVASRPSVRILVDSGAGVRTLGHRLGVSAVLQWSLRRSDSAAVVAARLVRASDERQLWSDAYQRPVRELGAIPEEIRRVVTVALLGRVAAAEARPLPTNDMTALDLYVRGRFAHSKWTPAGLDQAAQLFRQAIERDSSFALAYTWLANVHMRAWSGSGGDRLRRAKPLLATALQRDSSLALGHRLAGSIAMWHDRDWVRAERHLRQALAIDSSDVRNYHWYAAYFAATGRTDEALAMARRATLLDPVSSISATEVGVNLYWRREYDEAIAVLERAMQVDTMWEQRMPLTLGKAYLAVGRYDDAIRAFRTAGVQSSFGLEAPALLTYALGIAGRPEATVLVRQYVERARASSARPADLAVVHLGLRDTARALDWLEQLPDDRNTTFYLPSEPIFDPLRGSPRFQRVLERLNLREPAAP